MLPEYIQLILPPIVGKQNYNMRNCDNFKMYKSNKNYFLKSYIPSSIKTWNESAIDIKRATSLLNIKSKLSDLYGSSTYHLFLAEDGNGAVNHSRIRMGLSGLNAQRRKYNFIDSSKCNYCNSKTEHAKHFLLFCPSFAALRHDMLYEMEAKVPQTVQPYIPNYQNSNNLATQFCNLLIFGTTNINIDKHIFEIVQNFIATTNRFA